MASVQKVVGEKIEDYPKKTYSFAAVAVDVTLFRLNENKLQVLLLKLKEKPFSGKWALPGGLVTHKESLEKSAFRHLQNKIGLKDEIFTEQLYTFGDPERDPLGWVVSVVYLGLTNNKDLELKAADRYEGFEWFNLGNELPELAYDHKLILNIAVNRLTSKVGYTNIIQYLINEEYTLTELQKSYEILLGRSLDKRNFRKKILSSKLIKPLQKMEKSVSKRPAKLYKFTSNKPTELTI